MKCEDAEALMAGLLLGEIAPEDRRAVEEHLLECAACRADFERARLGGQVEWPDRPVPPALAGDALAAIRRPVPVLWFLRWATAAAVTLCAALFMILADRKPAPTATAKPPSFSAMMQQTGLGSLVAKDEEGRPVGELGLRSHTVDVEILDGIAKTTVEENFENHTDRRLEGTFHFPLPPDASISRLALEVNGKIEEGTCLERERAREVFETIVRRMQDPALLEWMPGGIFKCRVFPIEPRATKRVIVAYTQALPFFRGRISYVYPLASEKTRTHPPGEVRIEVRARFSGNLAKIESPSHRVDVQRRDGHEARMVFSARDYRPEEDFVLVMETEDEEVRVVPHKVDGEDGYFALFLTPRGDPARKPRKYVFILDVSASVSGPELDVAKRLVLGMMQRVIPGDRFEILAHHIEVERSGEVDARSAGGFLDRLQPVGGSDVLKALLAAPEGEILYIGEGTPTMGETDPAKILEAVKGRRIRTVAVGSDANVQLLERLGAHFRVNPNDHVARRVEEIASTMGCEALRDLRVEGGEAIYDVVGVRDLFYGERLAVVGRYRGPAAKFVVAAGDYRREVDVALPLKEEGNNYVRRLWAQRKVADLLARGGSKDEVTALGVKYQIMTPYTSFLVLESEEMWKQYNLRREVQGLDEVLGKRRGEFEEFAVKRLEEASGRSLKEVGVEAGALDRLARMKGGEEGRRVLELTEKVRNAAMSQFGGRMKIKPSATPQEVEERLRRYRDIELRPEPAPTPPPPAVVPPVDETPRVARVTTRSEGPQPDPRLRVVESLDSPGPRIELVSPSRNAPLAGATFTLTEAPEFKIEDFPGPDAALNPEPTVAPIVISGIDEPEATTNSLGWSMFRGGGRSKGVGALEEEIRPEDQALLQKLRSSRVSLDLQNAPLTAAVERLREATGLNFVIDTKAIEKPDEALVSLKAADAGVDGALRLMLGGRGSYAVRDGTVVITPGGERRDEDKVGIYDVQDLAHGIQDFPGVDITLARESAGEEDRGKRPLTGEEMARLMRESLPRGSDEQFIQYQNGLLVVRGPDRNHEAVQRVLSDLRFSGRLSGADTARFVAANDDFLDQIGIKIEVAPKKALEGKVTAVAPEIGLVVISVGRDAGVGEGDRFTIYRDGGVVSEIVIDRVDRKWAAGKVLNKKVDPRPADDVSNQVVVAPPVAASVVAAGGTPEEIVLGAGSKAGLKRGHLLAVTRDGKFVAMVVVLEASEGRARVAVWRGMAVGPVLAGDRAERVESQVRYLAGLPREVRLDLASRMNLEGVRSRMRREP